MHRFAFLCCVAVLAAPAHAQNGSGIFMGDDMALRAEHPLQLSLNAHVTQFLYQPTSDHIAYVNVQDVQDTETTTVEYVTTRHANAETTTLESVTGDLQDAPPQTADIYTVSLKNWSSDGRYLVFEVDEFAAKKTPMDTATFYVADTAAQAFAVQTRQLPAFPTPKDFFGLTWSAWSPSQSRLLIAQEGVVTVAPDTSVTQLLGALYDPASGQMHVLQVPSQDRVLGWQDEGHLLLHSDVDVDSAAYFSYDVATDIATPIPHGANWPPKTQSKAYYTAPVSATTPKAPGLTLEADQQSVPDPQSPAIAPVWTVWLRRPSAPKPMSALAVAVVHDADRTAMPSSDAEDDADPQPQWASNGDAVAYLAHGDLFVAPLTENPVTAFEKVALGEKLDCAEEKLIIGSNLKQIGLALMEYTQDNDEKFPTGAGWQDAIMPYVKDSSLFNFAGISVNYIQPPGITIASIDSPADMPMATADTPCAHIVLFADGHVKAFDRNGNQ